MNGAHTILDPGTDWLMRNLMPIILIEFQTLM